MIATTHAGSLPRPAELIEANARRELEADGITPKKSPELERVLRESVFEVLARQKAIGITIPGDGEYGHVMGSAVNYGSWWGYIFDRVDGLGLTHTNLFNAPSVRSRPGEIRLTSFPDRRDRHLFAHAYADPISGVPTTNDKPELFVFPSAVGPLAYSERGRELVNTDIANFTDALAHHGYEHGYMASLSPGSAARIADEYYGDDDAFLDAWVEVMRPEYRAIADAGLTVQVDDPSLAENWDQINPEPSVPEYLAFTRKRVEAINRALEGIDPSRVRVHLCWGSWHGPHVTDLEFTHLVSLMLEIQARYYSFEAANARHEHEWVVWKDVELPADKVIVPGVVSHATNVVEHPQLVAQRIQRFADIVGPERVIASTDCGLGGRIHPQIAWAKLEALVEGAALASRAY